MSEERFAEIVRDYQEQEPGFYRLNREWRMMVMQELITEVRRLRTPPDLGEIGTLLDAVSENARMLGEFHAVGADSFVAEYRQLEITARAELDRALASLQARAVRGERERDAVKALDLAAANVLLAFHDYPQYEGGVEERRYALDTLADRVLESRAALASPPTTGERRDG